MIDIQIEWIVKVTPDPLIQSDFVFTFILLLSINHVFTLLYVKHVGDYELNGEMAYGSVISRKHLVSVLWNRDFFAFSAQHYCVVRFSFINSAFG